MPTFVQPSPYRLAHPDPAHPQAPPLRHRACSAPSAAPRTRAGSRAAFPASDQSGQRAPAHPRRRHRHGRAAAARAPSQHARRQQLPKHARQRCARGPRSSTGAQPQVPRRAPTKRPPKRTHPSDVAAPPDELLHPPRAQSNRPLPSRPPLRCHATSAARAAASRPLKSIPGAHGCDRPATAAACSSPCATNDSNGAPVCRHRHQHGTTQHRDRRRRRRVLRILSIQIQDARITNRLEILRLRCEQPADLDAAQSDIERVVHCHLDRKPAILGCHAHPLITQRHRCRNRNREPPAECPPQRPRPLPKTATMTIRSFTRDLTSVGVLRRSSHALISHAGAPLHLCLRQHGRS